LDITQSHPRVLDTNSTQPRERKTPTLQAENENPEESAVPPSGADVNLLDVGLGVEPTVGVEEEASEPPGNGNPFADLMDRMKDLGEADEGQQSLFARLAEELSAEACPVDQPDQPGVVEEPSTG
jgi:hypothetical protein